MSSMNSEKMLLIIGLFITLTSTLVHSFYYQNFQMAPAVMYASESSPYAVMNERSDNIYNDEQQWVNQFPYSSDQQQETMLEQASTNRMTIQQNDDNICQGGFVEHCLVQANQDGEQSMLEISSNNQTANLEKEVLSREFDGMCQVVIRFIDCINLHYFRCNPSAQGQKNANTDVFFNSWTNMCTSHSKIRNKYLQHAKCIKQALSHNNGQEQCQALFQSYFMLTQFSLDSMENTIQYGCCAFNEWQFCIDSLIQKQCGPDATKAIQDLIDQASGGLVSSLCEKKVFGRKSKACIGKKNHNYSKLKTLDPIMNATLQKYISIFGDFIDRLPDDDDEETPNSK